MPTPGLVYHWIAEYRRGDALPEYDHDTGRCYRFRDIDGAEQMCKQCGLESDFTDGPKLCSRCGGSKFFSTVERGRLKSLGWYPFTEKIAERIMEANPDVYVEARPIPVYKLDLKLDEFVLAFRRNMIHLGTNKSLTEWQLGRPWLSGHNGDMETALKMQRKHGYSNAVPHYVAYYVIGYRRPDGRERQIWVDYNGKVEMIER